MSLPPASRSLPALARGRPSPAVALGSLIGHAAMGWEQSAPSRPRDPDPDPLHSLPGEATLPANPQRLSPPGARGWEQSWQVPRHSEEGPGGLLDPHSDL